MSATVVDFDKSTFPPIDLSIKALKNYVDSIQLKPVIITSNRIKPTKHIPNFSDKNAQNVDETWCEVYYLAEQYFPTQRVIYSFHIGDDDCSSISAINHYLRTVSHAFESDAPSASKLSQKSNALRWLWYATYTNGNINYAARGATNENPIITDVGRSNTPRPRQNCWTKGPDGSGLPTYSNIRGFINYTKLRCPSITIFIAANIEKYSLDISTSNYIIAALAVLTKSGSAFIGIGPHLTTRDMTAIKIASQLFEKTKIVCCGHPYLVCEKYIEPLGVKRINLLMDAIDSICPMSNEEIASVAKKMNAIYDSDFNPAGKIHVVDIDRRLLL